MNARLAIITFVDGQVDPGYGQSGGRPSQGLPGDQPYPDQGLPSGGGRPDQSLPPYPGLPVTLPVFPFDPTIDNSLPGTKPPHASTQPIVPGSKFVVKWLACKGLVLVPDQSLPGSQPGVDNTLPGSQPQPGQGLPPVPGRPDQSLPPTSGPKK